MCDPYAIHVYPAHNGEPEHHTDGGDAAGKCWCDPIRRDEGDSVIWLHRRTH